MVQAGQTVTVNPRRGSQDKEPWRKNLDLTAITGQTIESEHLFDVHLGETVFLIHPGTTQGGPAPAEASLTQLSH